ncbi:hypothetical protein QTP88_024219 [Uroleucon formosanum]
MSRESKCVYYLCGKNPRHNSNLSLFGFPKILKGRDNGLQILVNTLPVVEDSGKQDKSVLSKISSNVSNGILLENCKTKTEKIVASLFCETLKTHNLNIEDNFFENGGHSLLAACLIGELNCKCGT